MVKRRAVTPCACGDCYAQYRSVGCGYRTVGTMCADLVWRDRWAALLAQAEWLAEWLEQLRKEGEQ